MSKRAIWMGALVGSLIGGYIPVLFGDSGLSFWSILFGTLGGLAGIAAVYRLYRSA